LQDHKQENVQKTANKIAEDAHHLSLDENYQSPFSLSAIDAGIDLTGKHVCKFFFQVVIVI